jgi:hypothetical protein
MSSDDELDLENIELDNDQDNAELQMLLLMRQRIVGMIAESKSTQDQIRSRISQLEDEQEDEEEEDSE